MKEKRKIVRIYSLDRRYRKEPYQAVAPEDNRTGLLLTGQNYSPEDEEFRDGLTYDEMIGKVEITPRARREKYAFVINPTEVHPLLHGRPFDLTIKDGKPLNPRDYWEFRFFTKCARTYAGNPLVAESHSRFQEGRNYYYVEDKEVEAVDLVLEIDQYALALDFVRNKAIMDYRPTALLLNYYVDKLNINPDQMTDNQLKAELYSVCKSDPDKVLMCDPDVNPRVKKEVFFLELASHGIIKFDPGTGFSDGSTFIGANLPDCLVFASKESNANLVAKWGVKLRDKQANVRSPYELVNS